MKTPVALIAVLVAVSPVDIPRAAEAVTNEKCLECHGDKDLTKETADGKEVSIFVDEAKLKSSVHGKSTCVQCHKDLVETHPDDGKAALAVDCAGCHKQQTTSFGESVHGIALGAGNKHAATCKDCHGTHDVFSLNSENSPIHFTRVVQTCGKCHEKAAADVSASVHGQGIAKGERDAATCVACHSEHRILGLKDASASSRTSEACSKCHASERINSRFSMPGDRVKTFFESYHGLAGKGGSTLAANCASCHGYHRILPSADADSTIHPSNLLATCGKCHPGASSQFVSGKIHTDEQTGAETGLVVNRWVRKIYVFLIVATGVLLGLHNGIAWWRKVRARRREQTDWVIRMDRNQRFQHFILMTSFIVLAVTGFALKFPTTWFAHLMGSEEIRRGTHRIAGLVLLAAGVYHVGYVCFSSDGRRFLRDIFPRWRDLKDVGTNLGHLLAGRPRAKFARFGYPEKIEYWAVVWGTVIMGVTGLAIWLKIDVTQWLPRWIIDVSITIHYYEAILACLAIIVWHFYHVMFDPDVYPMNWAWLDGKVPRELHEEEHPLEIHPENKPDDSPGPKG